MIRALIVDFGGVLVRTRTDRSRRALETRLGLLPNTLENRVFGGELSMQGQRGAISEDEFWQAVAHELGCERIGLTPEAFRTEFFADDFLDEDLVAFIRGVRPHVKTGLISNAWSGLRNMLHTTAPIADAFDALVISAEEKMMKPDPRIYQLALDRLGVRADEAIFLDDFQVNINACTALGMHGVHFKSAEQAQRDIRSLLA
ncbi:MAG: HAD family phosphatase [Chloroflexi bacterium]|nr:HAD family phosphatase [Chloroflexota bacterium]